MRTSFVLYTAVTASLIAAACGGSDSSTFNNGQDQAAGGSGKDDSFGGTGNLDDGTHPTGVSAGDIDATSIRIEPADAVITVGGGQVATQAYKVFGKVNGEGTEQDITKRVVFYVPDNFLVGGFPLDGGPLFSTRLPANANDPPQRGGKLTVEAIAANSTGTLTAKTSLTVKLRSELTSPIAGQTLPANPASKFQGAPVAARKPQLVYPNDGTMLPPNLRRLDIQWRRGNNDNQLFEVSLKSESAEIVYYSRCGGGAPTYLADACAFELDETGYGQLAESNRGAGPVKLRIRGTNDDGTAFGESDEFSIEFAENRVDGGLYYWNLTTQAIMRFDFGAASGDPEAFISNSDAGGCPGCHALSRDGKKLVASIGGQQNGRLVYVNDLSKPKTDPNWLTVKAGSNDGGLHRIQFASFNPEGSQFVAVYGDNATSGGSPQPSDLNPNKLFFHDGTSGLRVSYKQLDFKPDHPEWSPDGQTIAVSHVGNANTPTQRPKRTSIDILKKSSNGWDNPIAIVPSVDKKARYNPSFVPDSSFFYYSESICQDNWDSDNCDADADPSAKTWAVKPVANATPVQLANSAKRGVADNGETNLGDTFPRSAPFKTEHRGGRLFWFTVASRRKAGLRDTAGAQHLWMFAVDPDKVLAGQDGSYTGFYLPFQDLRTSNHIGQWTEKVIGGTQPQPPAPPPPPPAPVPPPPVPR